MKKEIKRFSSFELPKRVAELEEKALPSGNDREIVSFDSEGKVISTTLTPNHWTDFQDGAPTSGQWLAAAQFDTTDQPEMGFVEVALLGDVLEYKIPFYTQGGKLNVGLAEYPENAVQLVQLDIRVPEPPTTGSYTLQSVNGTVSWVVNV